jgi:hypothetical protein
MRKLTTILGALLLCALLTSCDGTGAGTPTSAGGVKQAGVQVATDTNGHTVEQNQIASRLEMDNKPGSIKHLYVISAYSGQVIIYSTVKGKVTSSGKRLTPTTVAAGCAYQQGCWGQDSNMGKTGEVIQDDGTYGSSAEYIYWFDSKGIYHQHYISGGQIVHISSEPLAVKNVIINLDER